MSSRTVISGKLSQYVETLPPPQKINFLLLLGDTLIKDKHYASALGVFDYIINGVASDDNHQKALNGKNEAIVAMATLDLENHDDKKTVLSLFPVLLSLGETLTQSAQYDDALTVLHAVIKITDVFSDDYQKALDSILNLSTAITAEAKEAIDESEEFMTHFCSP